MAYLYQILSTGLHNGALYALLAYGYVLLHQVVPKPNLAHGAFFALSGQVFVLAVNFAYNGLIFNFLAALAFGLFVSLALSSIAVGFFAVAVVPRFRNRSPNMMTVATLALAIVLMEAFRIGADGRDFWLPPLQLDNVQLGFGASVTRIQLFNMLMIAALLLACEWVLVRTAAGRAVRAVAQESVAASLLGVNVEKTVVATAMAAGVLSFAGGILAVLYFGNMSFGAGLSYGLKVLFIASAGGFSTPRIAAVAAFAFGESEALWDGYMPIVWRDVFFYAVLATLLVSAGRKAS